MTILIMTIGLLVTAAVIGVAVKRRHRKGWGEKDIKGCECCQDQAAELERPIT